MGTPLYLETTVGKGESLNVGNANLFNLSWGLIFNLGTPTGVPMGSSWPEPGTWTSVTPDGCGENPPVTVTAKIHANWSNGGDATTWHWWDLRDAFAAALWGVMQAVSNPTGYKNYSYTETPPIGGTGRVFCRDPQFLYWGHYIPPGIEITAYEHDGGGQVGQVTVTYSVETLTGGDICAAVKDAEGGVLPLFINPETAALAALVGASTTFTCDIVNLL